MSIRFKVRGLRGKLSHDSKREMREGAGGTPALHVYPIRSSHGGRPADQETAGKRTLSSTLSTIFVSIVQLWGWWWWLPLLTVLQKP